jgi:fatty acid desaturase
MHHRAFREALLHGAFHGLKCQYRTWARQLRAGSDSRRQRGRALLDLVSIAAAGFLYFGATTLAGISPLFTVVPMILAFPLVFSLRALCDHYGVPASMPSAGNRPDIVSPDDQWRPAARRVTGWVVLTHPWLEWLWSSVNYHEVHHKFPHLAHCDLKPVFQATRTELPYLTVDGYGQCLRVLSRLPYYPEPEAVADYLTTTS